MKRKSTVLLCLLLTACMLFGCGGQAEAPVQSAAPSAGTTAEQAMETAEADPAAASEDRDLNGYVLHLAKIDQEKIAWSTVTFAASELNGEVVNDAFVNRNLRLKEKYNFDMEETSFTDGGQSVIRSIQAGDDICQVYYNRIDQIAPQVLNGYYIDLNSIPELSLDENWWEQGMIRDLSVLGHMNFISGDLVVSTNDCVQVVYYCKKLAEDLGITGLYDLVKGGNWTSDRMIEMMKAATADTDGDGAMTHSDRYGLLYGSTTVSTLLAGMGGRTAMLDKDGMPQFTADDQKMADAFEKTASIFRLGSSYNYSQFTKAGYASSREGIVAMFDSEGALFYGNGISAAAQYMRQCDADYGFLPYPKLNETQDDYASQVSYTAAVLAVPVTCGTPNEVGFILEALCRDSTETIQKTYYDICFSAKYTRDAESYDMLLIAVRNRLYDIGAVFDWGGMMTALKKSLESGSDSLSSTVESLRSKTEADMQASIRQMQETIANGGQNG